MRLEVGAWQVLRAGGVTLSGFSKSFSRSPSVQCAEPGGERWEQETGLEPPGAEVKGLQDGRNDLLFSSPEWYSRGDAAVTSGGAVAAGGGIPLPEPPLLQPHLPAF